MIRKYQGLPKWLTSIILKRWASLTYQVKTDPGIIWKCHVDQLHAVSPDTSNNATNADSEGLIDVSPIVRDPTTSVSASAPSVPNLYILCG